MPDDDPQWRFHRLWATAEPAVVGLVRSLVADRHLADDLVQDTALALFRSLDQYDPTRPFVAWALGVAKNKVRDAWRAARRSGAVTLDEAALEALAAAGLEAADAFDEERRALEACLRKVEGRERELLERHYHRGEDQASIASALALRLDHVRVLLSRVRQALRACIARRLQEGP